MKAHIIIVIFEMKMMRKILLDLIGMFVSCNKYNFLYAINVQRRYTVNNDGENKAEQRLSAASNNIIVIDYN